MTFTVIIPTLNEADRIATTLRLTARLGFDAILVVDGGSTDGTTALVEAVAAQVGDAVSGPVQLLSSQVGRARQLNAGAAAATSDVLVFLHADSHLPLDARRLMEEALADPHVVGGRFNVRFDRPSVWGQIISTFMNARSRITRISTGDQAMFVRRRIFEQLGGFSDMPIMEDIELSTRLKWTGRTATIDKQVTTSFRRWERQGPLRTILLMWALRFLYWIGVSARQIAQFYRDVR